MHMADHASSLAVQNPKIAACYACSVLESVGPRLHVISGRGVLKYSSKPRILFQKLDITTQAC